MAASPNDQVWRYKQLQCTQTIPASWPEFGVQAKVGSLECPNFALSLLLQALPGPAGGTRTSCSQSAPDCQAQDHMGENARF